MKIFLICAAVNLIRIFQHQFHHVQHLSSGGGAVVLPIPSGDGFEAENSINFLGQSILFHSLFLHYETFQTELLNHFSN